jgi:hypothetical protein
MFQFTGILDNPPRKVGSKREPRLITCRSVSRSGPARTIKRDLLWLNLMKGLVGFELEAVCEGRQRRTDVALHAFDTREVLIILDIVCFAIKFDVEYMADLKMF